MKIRHLLSCRLGLPVRSAPQMAACLAVMLLSTGIMIGSGWEERSDAMASPSPRIVAKLESMTKGTQAELVSQGSGAEERNELIPFSNLPIEGVASFRAIPISSPDFANAFECLSQAIYFEAANESLQGKQAVAQVVLNRVRHPAYPGTVCGVVYEGWNRPVCQFSFTCDGALLRPAAGPRWAESRAVAKAALTGKVAGQVGSATHYHADYVVPRWAYTLAKVEHIGSHIFYRFPSRWGGARALTSAWQGGERIPNVDRAWLLARVAKKSIETEAAAMESRGFVAPHITDRHAYEDIGGRLDPSKEWRLTIPDPTSASSTFRSAVLNQGEGATSLSTGDGR